MTNVNSNPNFFPDFLAAASGRGGVGIGGTSVVLVSNLNEEVRMILSLISLLYINDKV